MSVSVAHLRTQASLSEIYLPFLTQASSSWETHGNDDIAGAMTATAARLAFGWRGLR